MVPEGAGIVPARCHPGAKRCQRVSAAAKIVVVPLVGHDVLIATAGTISFTGRRYFFLQSQGFEQGKNAIQLLGIYTTRLFYLLSEGYLCLLPYKG